MGGDRARCVWCRGSGGTLRTIHEVTPDRFGLNPAERAFTVHPEHERETREFLTLVRQSARVFLVAIIVFTVAGVALAAVAVSLAEGGGDADRWIALLFGLYTLALGLFVVRYPFATPETVKWLGLRRARAVTRGCGGLTVGLGVWILTLGI